ncbi:hypothetical protein ACFQPF_08490 [Fictibacillus iocasae]|uniref:Uncharacterized protein n=1 Tax=Fictibacillus iocasae TaxID=2715437 RepID=A0ABW2NR55_9BACL
MAIYYLGPVQNFWQHRGDGNTAALELKIKNTTNKDITVLVEGSGKTKNDAYRLFRYLNSISAKGELVLTDLMVNGESFSLQISSTTIEPTELEFDIIGKLNGSAISQYKDAIKFLE